MFDNIRNLEGIIESLRLKEVMFRNNSNYTGNFLNADEYYIQAWEALADLSDEYVFPMGFEQKMPCSRRSEHFCFCRKDGHRPSLYIYKRRVWTYFLSDLMIPSRMCVSAWIFCNL